MSRYQGKFFETEDELPQGHFQELAAERNDLPVNLYFQSRRFYTDFCPKFDFCERRASYHFETEEFRNWRALEFFQ